MWLLLLMIFIMPFETNPYLHISDSLFGVIQDFTVIKLLGMIGFGWAVLRIMNGGLEESLFGSRQAKLFLGFYAGILFAGLLSGSGLFVISRYLGFLLFMPFVLVAIRTHDDLAYVRIQERFDEFQNNGFRLQKTSGVEAPHANETKEETISDEVTRQITL